ncbi:MAG TPA: amidohydrolase family protein [Acidimicrobiales bacterium]|nr:amidohydrolase family protein [Acidimicrobiales bacterium]
MNYPVISADSHITEPAETYVDYIDPAFADRAPRLQDCGEDVGDAFIVDSFPRPLSLGTVAAAGKAPEEIRQKGSRFRDLHRGGWDPEARMADQVRDGVAAEVIYPSIGMIICNHPDLAYKKACFDAYNRWMANYCSAHPDRLIGLGQSAMRTPEEGIADLEAIKALGLRGVMMPGEPGVEDYDSPIYDEFWAATVELGVVPSFHILTMKSGATRGPKMNGFLSIVRGCQDVMGMLVLGGVFERNPGIRVVCAEADAGWVPHFMYRLDHAYNRHRNWLPAGQELTRPPSEYFADNIYVTFQDDWTAFKFATDMNWKHLLWANDFPHSDSTWPWSQELLAKHTAQLTAEQTQAILSGNVADLYRIDLQALATAAA